MSTVNNQSTSPQARSLDEQVIAALDSYTLHMPIEQMLQELQIAVERLSFTGVHDTGELTIEIIESLLKHDVSSGVLQFIHWMHSNNFMRLIYDKGGRLFLSFCTNYYANIQEVQCFTAIELTPEFRKSILAMLRTLYPVPKRIIFQTTPDLLVGCVIDDGAQRTDMSLQKVSHSLLTTYLKAQKPEVAHG